MELSVKELLDQIMEDGVITRDEHDEFVEAIFADGQIDDDENAQITRMFEAIKAGKIKIVDSEREAASHKRHAAITKNVAGGTEKSPVSVKEEKKLETESMTEEEKLAAIMKNLGG